MTHVWETFTLGIMVKEQKVRELPECPSYVAHPQSVWFEEHWCPAYLAKCEELDEIKALVEPLTETAKKYSEELSAAQAEIEELKGQPIAERLFKVERDLLGANKRIARLAEALGKLLNCFDTKSWREDVIQDARKALSEEGGGEYAIDN